MDYKGFVLELMVNDVGKSIDFYQHIMGFDLMAQEEEQGRTYWAMMTFKDVTISFKDELRVKSEQVFMHSRSVGGGAILCFQVYDLEVVYSELKKKCALYNHPHLTPCGATEFSLQDNSGYVITFERH